MAGSCSNSTPWAMKAAQHGWPGRAVGSTQPRGWPQTAADGPRDDLRDGRDRPAVDLVGVRRLDELDRWRSPSGLHLGHVALMWARNRRCSAARPPRASGPCRRPRSWPPRAGTPGAVVRIRLRDLPVASVAGATLARPADRRGTERHVAGVADPRRVGRSVRIRSRRHPLERWSLPKSRDLRPMSRGR